MKEDYQIYKRTPDEAGKYAWLRQTPDFKLQEIIVTSYADMQFKFSPGIYAELQHKLQNPHFGYPNITKSFWAAFSKWITTRYCPNMQINGTNSQMWNNTVCSFHGAIEVLTQVGDQVLLFVPGYYFFNKILKYKKRIIVQCELEVQNGRFYINFERLQEILKTRKIKVLLFVNPWNPCGRIWSKQELKKLVDLVIKYDIYIISDEIYSDTVEPTQQQQKNGKTVLDLFTSLLIFEQVYRKLVYISSYSKAFNSSGMPLSYSICFDKDIAKRLSQYRDHSGSHPNLTSYKILQVCYSTESARIWKKNTIEYIRNNFNVLKKQCSQKIPKLIIYDMQCSYLCLVDFKQYNIKGPTLKKLFSNIKVYPIHMDLSYLVSKPRSTVRLNLGLNVTLVVEMVERLRKGIEQIQKQQQIEQETHPVQSQQHSYLAD